MGDRGGFPYGCGAGGVQEAGGAGDAEQVIGVRVVEQASQVGVGDTGDVIGDVVAATGGETSTLVGGHAEGDGGVVEGRGTGRGVDDGVGAALGGGLGESLHDGHAELSHAWISHRNSVAEMDVIICKTSGENLKLSCTPTVGARYQTAYPSTSLRTGRMGQPA